MFSYESTDRGLDLSFASSFLVTLAVAVAPSFVAFGFLVWSRPDPHPVLATIASLLLTAGSFGLGSKVWHRQPESAGFSFADLMLWHWVRREWAEEKLVRNARLLGYDRTGRFVGKVNISPARQLRAAREIGAALDAKSSYTINHSKRVEKHVRQLGASYGLSLDQIEELATSAALHDIGNLRIPEHVSRKAGALTREERSTIQGHVLLGAIMAFDAGGEDVVKGLRHHHERWDGTGYPSGLRGQGIPLYARMIGIAEAYDAMTSTRPYRQSLTQDQAVEVLRTEAGAQFDGELVELFVATLPEPLQIVESVPGLAWAQRQLHELRILFRRVGAVAISAAASTVAIALILGTAMLNPSTFGGVPDSQPVHPDRNVIASGDGGEDPRVLGARLAADELGAFSSAPGLGLPEGSLSIPGDAGGDRGPTGGDTHDPGDQPGGGDGGGGGGGNGGDGGNDGGGNDNDDDGGSVDPGPVVTVPEPDDGGSENVGPGKSNGKGKAKGHARSPGQNKERGGKSHDAPGHNKDDKDRGKSEENPGHNKDEDKGKPSDPDDSGGDGDSDGPGKSDEAPGHSDDGGSESSGSDGNNGKGNDDKPDSDSNDNGSNGNSDNGKSSDDSGDKENGNDKDDSKGKGPEK